MDKNTIFIYTSDVGVIRFAYDSPFWLTDLVGISSVEVAAAQTQSAGQIGSTVNEQSIQPRTFTLDGCIFEPLGDSRATLIRVMAPGTNGRLEIRNGEDAYYLDVVITKTPEISLGLGQQEFQVELLAAYPFWRTSGTNRQNVAGLKALFQFPFNPAGKWYISEYLGKYFNIVTNEGNVPTGFELELTARADVENPELYHVATRSRILLQYTMKVGETITISTLPGQKSVWLTSPNGVRQNGFRYLSLDSDLAMTLQPGENMLRVNADSLVENLDVVIYAPKGVVSGV